jgi:hypothetical protein
MGVKTLLRPKIIFGKSPQGYGKDPLSHMFPYHVLHYMKNLSLGELTENYRVSQKSRKHLFFAIYVKSLGAQEKCWS